MSDDTPEIDSAEHYVDLVKRVEQHASLVRQLMDLNEELAKALKLSGRDLFAQLKAMNAEAANKSPGTLRQEKYIRGLLLRGICAQCGKNPLSRDSKRYCLSCMEIYRDKARKRRDEAERRARENSSEQP